MRHILIAALLLAGLLIVSCGGQSGNNSAKVQEINAVPVLIQVTEPRDLKEYITVSGKLEGWTDIVMTSETSGKIIELNRQLGDWVDIGDQIGRVDNLDFEIRLEQAKASVLAAEASYESAEMQMESSEKLYRENRISKIEYSQARSNLKNSLAGLNGAKANLEQANKAYDNSRFVAPVAGYIADLPVSIGEMLNMGMPICSIVNSNKLKIKTGVGEMNIMKLKKDQEVIIQSDQFDRTFVGRISGIGIRPLQNSAMYPVEIELDNSKNILLPGMAVKIRILSNVYQDIIYTSQNNLVRQYDNTYVFVVDEDNKAVRKQVFTGPEVGEDIIITSGLEFGEKLVIEGMENLDAGSAVEIRQSVD